MGYVAIRGGEKAVEEAARALESIRLGDGSQEPIAIDAIKQQLYFLHGKVLSEGGLYHPDLAALAVKQANGDALEAAFLLRAFRSTRPRLCESSTLDTGRMRLIRRISAAFKDIPGGQRLGPTPDYTHRLFRLELLRESAEAFRANARDWLHDLTGDGSPASFPKVVTFLRAEGLLPDRQETPEEPFDITRHPLIFPVPRSACLATMARAETGGLLAMAYSNMRGYGDVHPTVAELRVGYLPVHFPHPLTGEPLEIGEVLITECEVIAMYEDGEEDGTARFGLGYGACLGHNEVKAISMAILDRALQRGMKHGPQNPSENPEFVLLHVDGIESMGFCTHYKMPHYVTFQSDLDRLRRTQEKRRAAPEEERGEP